MLDKTQKLKEVLKDIIGTFDPTSTIWKNAMYKRIDEALSEPVTLPEQNDTERKSKCCDVQIVAGQDTFYICSECKRMCEKEMYEEPSKPLPVRQFCADEDGNCDEDNCRCGKEPVMKQVCGKCYHQPCQCPSEEALETKTL